MPFPKNILVLFSHWTLRLRPDSHAERSAEGGESKSRCTGCCKAAHCQGVAQCDSGLQIQYLLLETVLEPDRRALADQLSSLPERIHCIDDRCVDVSESVYERIAIREAD